jgi:hypothetical protein
MNIKAKSVWRVVPGVLALTVVACSGGSAPDYIAHLKADGYSLQEQDTYSGGSNCGPSFEGVKAAYAWGTANTGNAELVIQFPSEADANAWMNLNNSAGGVTGDGISSANIESNLAVIDGTTAAVSQFVTSTEC